MSKIALITTLLLTVMAIAIPTIGAVDDVERAALMALYNSTNGPSWGDNTGWGVGDPCDPEWYGVDCESGHVQKLILNSKQLSGPIPPELGNLSSLVELNLGGNHLTGPIPAELGNMGGLVDLELQVNQLSGPIPAELGNLSSLGWLYLNGNQLSGSIPVELGNLSNLTELSLSWNQLSGSIPFGLTNLSSLERLFLNNNPALVCWQTNSALIWAQGLDQFHGPDAVCPFVCLPVVISD